MSELSQQEKEELEREQREKNYNFVQLYKTHFSELRWLMLNHPLASSLLFFILEHMDNRNALVCSYKVLEDYFSKSRTTIYRAVKILEENGFICVLKVGSANCYVVNHDLAWTDKHTTKTYSQFDGKILVSHSENKDYFYQNNYNKVKKLKDPKPPKQKEKEEKP